jgi:PAS domain S-box-containing protein
MAAPSVPQSAAILEAVLQTAPMGVICLDSEGQIQVWSPEATRILGLLPEDIEGRAAPLELQLLSTQKPGETEHRLRRPDGSEVEVRVYSAAWQDAAGGTGRLVLIMDLGAAHAMEGKLLEAIAREQDARDEARAERRFRELLEAAPDAIIEVDAEGRIVVLNRLTESMFGYSREEILGRPVEILIPDSARARHEQHRAHYKAHPAMRPMGSGLLLEGQRKDGTRFPVEISLSPVASEDGFHITAVIRDVTERKAVEDNLRAVQDRYTRELAESNRELELRNQQIERANRLKSEFLASMSHELRTPLHTVIGFSELLAEEIEGPLNEKQKRFIEHIHRDSLHLLELINDILDLSKIESGRLVLRYEVFDFASMLDESLRFIQPQAEAKSQSLRAEIPEPLALEADRLRVKQVLLNLLSNAVKFTPEGGRIVVSALLAGPEASISVTDTGIGIPESEHESVFDKFYQVSATTKGVREGTGLGLAITRHLVEEHGGRIWVESEPGRGSKFTFTVPLRRRNGSAIVQRSGDEE